ncbi:hypothetical protein KTI63_03130 [Acinetobacter guillouiae]|uniref:GDSL-type esterase/lipase family protein n=1 Tax=Acinetobacter guillouiae TaxID=106649 RepID=UPI0021D2670C|nr:GDSL-type esterase/lipase family protein [Acinetobacter guillouiae]MCU4491458.1 hypothetical protein [Acinetobacter guillouiae]
MVDQIITKQQLIEASENAVSWEKYWSGNEDEDVITRLNKLYPTHAKALKIMMENGGFKPFETQVELLASVPLVSPTAAKALDTKKMFLWKNNAWVDTGLSELDLAKDFTLTNSLSFKPNLSSENLNDVISIGIYRQILDADATAARNYPNVPNASGTLKVIPTSGFIIQEYTTWMSRKFWRIKYTTNAWQPWIEYATKADFANALSLKGNLGTENLDTVVTLGIYRQLLDANATVANNYPNIANAAGVLEVIPTSGLVIQKYTTWYGHRFWRIQVTGYPFQPWNQIATKADIANTLAVRPNLGSENLETVVTLGIYRQANDSLATPANGYPVPPNNQAAGILEVITSGNLVIQEYTTWWGYKFWRIKIGAYAFQAWNQVARLVDLYKPYASKKIAWFGDSIVEGNSHPNGVASNLGATVSKFGFSSHTMSMYPGDPRGRDGCAMYRFAKAINTGDWASVIASGEWTRDNLADDNMPQINAMVATDWNTIDYIVIAFGTNDWTSSTPLGSTFVADPTGSTFIGATCYVIEQIQKKYPHIQICFISPVFRTRFFNTTPEQNSDTVTDTEGKYLVDYVDALLKMKDIYHIPVYDFYRNSGINSMTYTRYLGDGVHPNTNGVQLWTNKITAFMNSN